MPKADTHWLEQFSAGFFSLADRSRIALVGGDTVRGPLAATVTVHGRVPREKFIARDAAQSGDGVYVTGTPGDAAAGLQLFGAADRSSAAETLRHRFCYPEPRLSVGQALRGIATAMIDVSDGLHVDLCRLMGASGVGAELNVAALPLSDALLAVLEPERARQSAMIGGDDYELCFTAPLQHAASIAKLAATLACPIQQLGTVVERSGVAWLENDSPYAFKLDGFEHFGGD